MKKRDNHAWARTATLLITFLCCTVLLVGCGTHEVFTLLNDGEYTQAYRTFRKLTDDEKEELLEDTEAYIQNTVTLFTEGTLTVKVALRRFDSIDNFRMSELDEPLETAVNSVMKTYAETIKAENDKNDLKDMLEELDDLIELFPFDEMEDSPLPAIKQDFVQTYVNSAMTQVYEEKLEYDELLSSLSVLDDSEELYSFAMQAITDYQTAQVIEKAYTEGKALYESGDWEGAIQKLSSIPSDDSRYEEVAEMIATAQSTILENKFAEAQKFADSNYYDQAISLLNKLLDDGYDYIKVADKIKEYQAAKKDYEILSALEDVITSSERLSEKGDYEQALVDIRTFISKNGTDMSDEVMDQAQAAYSKIENSYVNMIVGKVETLREKGDYLSAINMLNNAVVSNERLNELRTLIESEKPVYLCEMTNVLVNSDRYSKVTDRIPTDTIGNQYSSANVYSLDCYRDDAYCEYYLGFQYDTLTGIVAPCATSENQTATFKIIGDGKVLYEAEMKRTTTPISLELDVSAVNFLTIEIDSDRYGIDPLLIDFAFTKSET